MNRNFIFFVIISLMFGVGMWGYIGLEGQTDVLEFLRLRKPAELARQQYASVSLTGVTVRTEIAETPAARQRGLAGHADLLPLEGMLFMFDKTDTHAFWMKGMTFPIDIIWINDGRVVDIAADVQPSSDISPPLYTPVAPANRVLEVQAGFAAQHNVKVGTPVSIRFDGSQ